jgi:hypothetical protein
MEVKVFVDNYVYKSLKLFTKYGSILTLKCKVIRNRMNDSLLLNLNMSDQLVIALDQLGVVLSLLSLNLLLKRSKNNLFKVTLP